MTFNPHPHEDRGPIGQYATMRLAGLRDSLEKQGELERKALAAGDPSPYATPHHSPGSGRGDITMAPDGVIYELPDYDSTLWQGERWENETTDADVTADLFREGEFVRHCRNRAGEVISDEAWRDAQQSRETLARQSQEAALALTSAGIPAFLPAHTPRASIVDPETEQRIDLLPLRRVNYFPAVAQARRADMVKHLEAYLTAHPETQLLTLTAGRRLFIRAWEDLRREVGAFHARINHLAKGWLFEYFGFKLVFRGTELGSVYRVFSCPFPRETGTEEGVWSLSVHLHAHTFGRFAVKLPEVRNRCFCRLLHVHWGAMWNFGGLINAAREACKYPIKPQDMDGLANEDHATLFQALRGMKLVQPLGELRQTIRARYGEALKGRRWATLKDGEKHLELRFRPDWNARPRDLPARANRAALNERARKRALAWLAGAAYAWALARAAACIARAAWQAGRLALARAWRSVAINAHLLGVFLAFCPVRPYEERAFFGAKRLKALERQVAQKAKPMNRIVARLAPANYFDRVTRPGLLVWNFNGDFAGLRNRQFVADYLAAVRAKLASAEGQIRRENEERAEMEISAGLLGNVHTSHTTGFDPKTAQVVENGI